MARSMGVAAEMVRRRVGRRWRGIAVKRGWGKESGWVVAWWAMVLRAVASVVVVVGCRTASVRIGRPSASNMMLLGVMAPWVRPELWRWVRASARGIRRVTVSPWVSFPRRVRRAVRVPATRCWVMRIQPASVSR
nr:hypothetical protein [Kribbella jejuensis]